MGKAFCSICALSGIIIIAMPVAIIGSNFVEFYSNCKKNYNSVTYNDNIKLNEDALSFLKSKNIYR